VIHRPTAWLLCIVFVASLVIPLGLLLATPRQLLQIGWLGWLTFGLAALILSCYWPLKVLLTGGARVRAFATAAGVWFVLYALVFVLIAVAESIRPSSHPTGSGAVMWAIVGLMGFLLYPALVFLLAGIATLCRRSTLG